MNGGPGAGLGPARTAALPVMAAALLLVVWVTPARADPNLLLLGEAQRVAVETGPASISHTDTRYGVNGTDLGIMWRGADGRTMVAFGDTYGPNGTDWRSGTLAHSGTTDLSRGMRLDDFVTDRPGHAKELLPSLKRDNVEMTKIATGGVAVGGRDYLAYMSVRHWGAPGYWTTNYAGLATSDDAGQTWTDVPDARRPNTAGGDDRFQMVAMAPLGGYVYLFGTPNGRAGRTYLARVRSADLATPTAYQFWTGTGGWRHGRDQLAVPILPGPVAEISAAYNQALHAWMIMYLDEGHHTLTLRLGLHPAGPWTPQIVIASAGAYPELYGGFLHPLSNGLDVYFTVSQFAGYNVSLMRLQLPGNLIATALNQLPIPGLALPNIGPPAPALPVPPIPTLPLPTLPALPLPALPLVGPPADGTDPH
ncbi:MAG TPA: DUF4185 domain-containing protein [Pseudonocardia sp.]